MGEQVDQSCQTVAFTYRWYRDFLEGLQSEGYTFGRFGDAPADGEVVLRHDVDLSPEAALRMARIEAERDVTATYCFLLTSALYNALEGETQERIREIESLGHDVGLHFSTHEYWDEPPRRQDVETQVHAERSVLRSVVTDHTDVVSFHVPPDWVLDTDFDWFENTYAPAYFSDIGYVADSTQRWRTGAPDPADLPDRVQILTHPGLWGRQDGDFETCVERAVTRTCRHARRKARLEFFEGVGDS